jgi:hypothetical protein
MRKIAVGKKQTLAEVMAQNNDVGSQVNYDRPVIEEATPSSAGTAEPAVPDACTALLIMSGATARWNINHFLIISKSGKRSGVGATASFEEWRDVLNNLAGGRM